MERQLPNKIEPQREFGETASSSKSFLNSWHAWIAIGTVLLLVVYVGFLLGRFDRAFLGIPATSWPLYLVLALGGIPLVVELLNKLVHGEFGSDLLAAVSIVTSIVLGEYLAGAIVVLMLSGGQTLEDYAVRSASSVLAALAARMPSKVHRKTAAGEEQIALSEVRAGDLVVVYPYEICPVDGEVTMGHGSMDESYLSGEPYLVAKSLGSSVLSGAINGPAVLEVRASHEAKDSRYAKIMRVMQDSAQQRPKLRRLGDQLGALYTPLAIGIAVLAWLISGNATRFLAVLVVATPCPLLIAIPVAVIGSISLAARRSIIIKDPAILERLDLVKVAMFDKTGTLTYGRPILVETIPSGERRSEDVLQLAASLEHYSKHPLSSAVTSAAQSASIPLLPADEVHEEPGQGLRGRVGGREVIVTSRKQLAQVDPVSAEKLPEKMAGMECVVIVDGQFGALMRFRDQPRAEGHQFVDHLGPFHGIRRVMLISGDRPEEVEFLAKQLGITEVYAGQSPEQKLEIVRRETDKGETLFMGDGINDAPSLAAATIGIAFGQASEITSEAADAVILDSSLERVDELLHISRRMRRIALQSAVGGMALSMIGMAFAAFGFLSPVAGAFLQETIDVLAVLNALRAASPPKQLSDLHLAKISAS
jgi:heavy metal translocating P-type ATPase